MKSRMIAVAVALSVSAAAQEVDLSKFSPNGRTLLQKLQQLYPGEIVPLFVKNGGELTVISFRPEAGDPRMAIYDQESKTIKLRKGADGKIDFSASDDIAHEFWHAYWHQVASKGEGGPDATTFKVFVAAREWIRKQEINFIGEGSGGSPPARWKTSGWEEFTDEYVAGTLNVMLLRYQRLAADVASGKRTAAAAKPMWDEVLTGKGGGANLLANLAGYRNSLSNSAMYQVRGSIASAVPDLPRRLAELYGLKF